MRPQNRSCWTILVIPVLASVPPSTKSYMQISTTVQYRRAQKHIIQSKVKSSAALINNPALLLLNFIQCLHANPANTLQQSAVFTTMTCTKRPILTFLRKTIYCRGARFSNFVITRIVSSVTINNKKHNQKLKNYIADKWFDIFIVI